jgi:hypothetical protein
VTADGSPAAAAALASGVGGRSSPQPPDPGPRAPHSRDRLAFVFPAYVGKARSVDPKRVAGRPREELAASRRAIRRRSAAATAPAREWTSSFRMMLLTWERTIAGEHERVSDLVRGSVGSAKSFDQAARHLARDRRPPRRRWCAGPAGMASAGCALSSSCSLRRSCHAVPRWVKRHHRNAQRTHGAGSDLAVAPDAVTSDRPHARPEALVGVPSLAA